MKPIEFCADSLDCLREFPRDARREAGFQLDRVQRGLEPFDWKPMSGAFRVLYVAKFADAVYVLHCFQKKTQATSRRDLSLAEQRYRDLLKERQ